jgi:hypothetical protein
LASHIELTLEKITEPVTNVVLIKRSKLMGNEDLLDERSYQSIQRDHLLTIGDLEDFKNALIEEIEQEEKIYVLTLPSFLKNTDFTSRLTIR